MLEQVLLPSATPAEKAVLQQILARMNPGVVQAVIRDGFKIAVLHEDAATPLPFPVEEFDVDALRREMSLVVRHLQATNGDDEMGDTCDQDDDPRLSIDSWQVPRTYRDIAYDHGARSPEQVEEFTSLLRRANEGHGCLIGNVGDTPVDAAEHVLVPGFHYYHGLRLASGWLGSPFQLLSLAVDPWKVGQVLTQPVLGPGAPSRLILLWERGLANTDGLADWYVCHEFGHALQHALERQAQPSYAQWWQAVKVEAQRPDSPPLTAYAANNEREWFAEAFAAWHAPEERAPLAVEDIHDVGRERLELNRAALLRRIPSAWHLVHDAIHLATHANDAGESHTTANH